MSAPDGAVATMKAMIQPKVPDIQASETRQGQPLESPRNAQAADAPAVLSEAKLMLCMVRATYSARRRRQRNPVRCCQLAKSAKWMSNHFEPMVPKCFRGRQRGIEVAAWFRSGRRNQVKLLSLANTVRIMERTTTPNGICHRVTNPVRGQR